MTDVGDAFGKLLGRQPSAEERQRLYQVRDALEIESNDALWIVLIALEHYDSLYREYPARLAKETLEVLRGQREVLAATVAAETARVQRSLADAVVATSEEIAGRRADAARWHAWAIVCGMLVLFGGLCVASGYGMGTGGMAHWTRNHGGRLGRVASAILGAPAGWMTFALLLPVAAHFGWTGWRSTRDAEAETRERITGWAMVCLSAVAIATSIFVLVKLT